ncbi:MAG TPA: HypC/HybG/HupF family hydrogenase formation chaperone [Candidatus Methylomirabilis sp.]|nr:HypC/HybG/HupF family hydrogenase formation chaperone [Candidatus Methylomirabilis sp.]
MNGEGALLEAEVVLVRRGGFGREALVRVGGAFVPVDLSLVREVRPGDRVLVQGRVALARIDRERSREHEVRR